MDIAKQESAVLLTIPQVVQLTNLGRSKVYQLLGSGELHAIKIGRSIRISRKALEDWLSRLELESEAEIAG